MHRTQTIPETFIWISGYLDMFYDVVGQQINYGSQFEMNKALMPLSTNNDNFTNVKEQY